MRNPNSWRRIREIPLFTGREILYDRETKLVTTDRWRQLESLFDRALSLSGDARTALLDTLRSRDAELAGELAQLLRNLDQASSIFDPPPGVWRRQALTPGEVVGERFEILELAGAGGMGEVYAAQDRELGERVALKVLPHGFGADLLHRELQAARRVSHPNVCRVFDLGRFLRDGAPQPFLTMEWIAGPTLAVRLQTGRLSAAHADLLLREVLAGLAAAHEAGVLHRDLKPSNVMLRETPLASGHTVALTDFGLAQAVATADAGDRSGAPLTGTPLYMAPEQIEGVPASVRSDLYAFGLCAYEVFTGVQPLANGGPLAALVKRARKRPPDPAALAPDTPPGWSRAILACLEPDAARRPADAGELLELVDRDRVPFLPRLSRRQVMIGTLSVAGAGAVATLWRFGPTASPATPGGARLLLAPTVNQTGEGQFAALGVVLRTQLAQSNHFQAVEPPEFPETLQLMLRQPGEQLGAEDLRHLALRLEIPLVLHATLGRVGESYALQMLLERVSAGSARAARTWAKTFLAENPRALYSALHEASLWLRQLTGESAEAISLNSKRPEEVTTDSWEALRDYSQGETEAKAGRGGHALDLFGSATRRDPQFVTAHMRMGDLYFGRGQEAEGLRSWQRAMQALDRRPCSRREELATRAMFASDTADYEASVAHYKELAQAYPMDERALRFQVMPLCLLDRRREAVEVAWRYVRMAPRSPRAWHQLAVAAIVAGDSAAASEALAQLRDGARTNDYHGLRFRFLFQRSDYDEAGEELRQAITVARDGGNVVRQSEYERRLAHYLAERNVIAGALRLLTESRVFSERSGLRSHAAQKLVSLAYLALLGDRSADAVQLAREALDADSSVERLRRCGTVFARAGERSAVRDTLAAVARFPQVRTARLAAATLHAEEQLKWPARTVPEDSLVEVQALLPAGWPREYALFRARALGTDPKPAARQMVAAKGIPWLTVEMDWPGGYGFALEALKDSDVAVGRELARLRQQ